MITVTEFTDPGCPYAFSAEPCRWRLRWLYEGRLDWNRRMVVLSESPEEYEARGTTPATQVKGLRRLQRSHRMPIDARERPRMHATAPACRAVVAARRHAPDGGARLLRLLRVLTMAGALLDEPGTLDRAAEMSGLDPRLVRAWMAEPETEAALRADMEAARHPSPAALVLDHRLAKTDQGHRYSCPSYVFETAHGRFDVPGFRPVEAYEVILANLAPDVPRRPAPATVSEALTWAGEPLATAEVAAICQLDFEEAREELARVATIEPVGGDGYWSLADEPVTAATLVA